MSFASMSFERFIAAHGPSIIGDPFIFYQVYQDLVQKRQIITFNVLHDSKSSHMELALLPRNALTLNAEIDAYKIVPVAADAPLQMAGLLLMLEALANVETQRTILLALCDGMNVRSVDCSINWQTFD
jgi:hypothetical protein